MTNSAISSGLGKGVLIYNSKKVTLDSNVIHDFITWGINGDKSSQLIINNNVINGIKTENNWPLEYMVWAGYNGGLYLGETSSDYVVTNNIAASTWHAGFMLPAYKCGDTQENYGNVAHSISGYGVIVQKPKKMANCLEFSDFKGYKTRIAVVHMGGGLGATTNEVHDIVAIDASTGLMAFSSDSGHVKVYDNEFYGDQNMPNEDCPILAGNPNCDQCIRKRGLWIPVFGKHETGVIKAPDKLGKMFAAGGSWGGSSDIRDNKFIGYERKATTCGGEQSAIVTNDIHPDYHPKANFLRTEFNNVDESAMFGFGSPKQGWANHSDCGDFTCTGLYNVLVEMEDTTYTGITRVFNWRPDFQVTANNKESISVQVVDDCE